MKPQRGKVVQMRKQSSNGSITNHQFSPNYMLKPLSPERCTQFQKKRPLKENFPRFKCDFIPIKFNSKGEDHITDIEGLYNVFRRKPHLFFQNISCAYKITLSKACLTCYPKFSHHINVATVIIGLVRSYLETFIFTSVILLKLNDSIIL